jgi:hypothetical protein
MIKTCYTQEYVAFAQQQAETGTPVSEVIRKMRSPGSHLIDGRRNMVRWAWAWAGPDPEFEAARRGEPKAQSSVADLSLDRLMLPLLHRMWFEKKTLGLSVDGSWCGIWKHATG